MPSVFLNPNQKWVTSLCSVPQFFSVDKHLGALHPRAVVRVGIQTRCLTPEFSGSARNVNSVTIYFAVQELTIWHQGYLVCFRMRCKSSSSMVIKVMMRTHETAELYDNDKEVGNIVQPKNESNGSDYTVRTELVGLPVLCKSTGCERGASPNQTLPCYPLTSHLCLLFCYNPRYWCFGHYCLSCLIYCWPF